MTDQNLASPSHARTVWTLVIGLIVVGIGLAILAGAVGAVLSDEVQGAWFIVGSAICAFGAMAIAASLAAQGRVWATGLFVAIPGALLAAVCFSLNWYIVDYSRYPPPASYSVIDFVLVAGNAAGWLWIVIGPVVAYLVRNVRRAGASSINQDQMGPNERRNARGLARATWFLGVATLVGPSLAVFLSKLGN